MCGDTGRGRVWGPGFRMGIVIKLEVRNKLLLRRQSVNGVWISHWRGVFDTEEMNMKVRFGKFISCAWILQVDRLRMRVCVSACACACMCTCAFMRVRAHARVWCPGNQDQGFVYARWVLCPWASSAGDSVSMERIGWGKPIHQFQSPYYSLDNG